MRQNARRINCSARRSPLFRPLSRASAVEASIVRLDHSHCIQPPGRTWSINIRNRGFAVMAALAMLCRARGLWALMRLAAYAAGVGCASLGCQATNAAEAEVHLVAAKPACLNAAETRETVKSRHLLEPFAALKSAGAQRKAEALSAKLCRIGEDFIYEITLLHRDGRLVHVEMEAGSGKIGSRQTPREQHEYHEPHEAHETHEPPAKN
jgi:hypothetical protein